MFYDDNDKDINLNNWLYSFSSYDDFMFVVHTRISHFIPYNSYFCSLFCRWFPLMKVSDTVSARRVAFKLIIHVEWSLLASLPGFLEAKFPILYYTIEVRCLVQRGAKHW